MVVSKYTPRYKAHHWHQVLGASKLKSDSDKTQRVYKARQVRVSHTVHAHSERAKVHRVVSRGAKKFAPKTKAKKKKHAPQAPPSALGLVAEADAKEEECKSCEDLANEMMNPTKPKIFSREEFEAQTRKLKNEVNRERQAQKQLRYEEQLNDGLKKANHKLQVQNP